MFSGGCRFTLIVVGFTVSLLPACQKRVFNRAELRSEETKAITLKPWDMHIPIAGAEKLAEGADGSQRLAHTIGIDAFLSAGAINALSKHMTLQFPYSAKAANGTDLDEEEGRARPGWKTTRAEHEAKGRTWSPRDPSAKRIAQRDCMNNPARVPWKVAGIRLSPREVPLLGSTSFWEERFPGKVVNRFIHFRLSFDQYCEMDFDGRVFAETSDAGVHVVFAILPEDPAQRAALIKAAAVPKLLIAGKTDEAMALATAAVEVMNSQSYLDWYRVTLAQWSDQLGALRQTAAGVKVDEFVQIEKLYSALASTAGGKSPFPVGANFPYSAAFTAAGLAELGASRVADEISQGVDPAFTSARLTADRLDALKGFLQGFAKRGVLAGVTTFLAFEFETWHWGNLAVGALTDDEAKEIFAPADRTTALATFKDLKPARIRPFHLDMKDGKPRAVTTSDFGFYNSGNEIDVANPDAETTKTAPARILDEDAFARADLWPGGAKPSVYKGQTIAKPDSLHHIVKSSDTRDGHLTTMACVTCHLASPVTGAIRTRSLSVGAGAVLTLMNSFGGRVSYRNALETVEDAHILAREGGVDNSKPPAPAPAPAVKPTCSVTDPTDTFALVREGGAGSSVRASINVGTVLNVLGTNASLLNVDLVAFVHSSVVKCLPLAGLPCGEVEIISKSDNTVVKGTDGKTYVTGANLRADANGAIIGVGSSGGRFGVREKSGNWYEISLRGSMNPSRCK